jgi:hypothetical protein
MDQVCQSGYDRAAMLRSLASAQSALRRVFANPDIRRAELAWMTGYAAEWAWLVALFVYAFGTGGVAAVGLIGLLRTLPAAVLAPAISSLTDRLPRHRVLLGVHLGRAAVIGVATTSVLAGWPSAIVFAIAPIDGLLGVLHRPTHLALIPSLARAPEELVASNAASSTLEAVGTFIGPVIGGGLLASGVTWLTFGVPSVGFLVAAAGVAGIRPAQALRRTRAAGVIGVLVGGARALVDYPHAALLIGLFGAQILVRGILNVLLVVTSVELLSLGEEGVGYLNAAVGAGGFVGALLAMSLVGRARLAPPFLLGLVLWGMPILLIGVVPVAAMAVIGLGVLGAGNAVLDVSGFTMIQRSVPNDVRGRVFGTMEAILMLGLGLGSAIAPLLVVALGTRGALIAAGALLPALALIAAGRVRRADDMAVIPERELSLLRGVPMFRWLPLTVLEQVAADAVPIHISSGTTIIDEGEVGDRFYVLAEGEAETTVHGRVVRRMLPGDSFGEIALLRNVRRTATVTATGEALAYVLDRDAFVFAVTGDHSSLAAAEEVIGERLSTG